MVSNEEIKRRLEEKRKGNEAIGSPQKEYGEDITEKAVEIQEISDTPQETAEIESYPGYLVCKDCNGYYKLEEGESPADFDICNCGGELVYVESIDEFTESDSDETLACPSCGYENAPQDKFCRECGHQLQ